MLTCKQKGISTELQCLAAFSKLGIQTLIPYGDYARYDIAIDINGTFYRIQCKTAKQYDDGVYKISCRSTAANHSRALSRSYTNKEIDFFATIIEDKCYLIPVDECGVNEKTLRFIYPQVKTKVGVSLATVYELETQIAKLLKE